MNLTRQSQSIIRLALVAGSLLLAAMPAMAGRSKAKSASTYKTNYVYREESNEIANRLQVNAMHLTMRGIGVSYERTVMNRFTLGPTFYSLKFAGESAVSSQVYAYGLAGRFFFNSRADESSGYLLGGVVATSAHTEVTFTNIGKSASGEASTVGPLAGIGYQWILGGFNNSTRTLINLGALYGSGFEVSASAYGNSLHAELLENEIRNSIFAELSLGLLF